MRLISYIVLAIIGLMLLALAGLWLSRGSIAETVITDALEQRGFENVSFDVIELETDRIRIENLRAGPDPADPTLRVDEASARFQLDGLALARVENLSVRGANVVIEDTGTDFIIAGVPLSDLMANRGSGDGTPFPLDGLLLEDISATVISDGGTAQMMLDAQYDASSGGSASAALSAPRYAWREYEARDTRVTIDLNITADREFSGSLSGAGSILTDGRTYPGLGFAADFSGPDFMPLLRDRRNAVGTVTFELSAPAVTLENFAQYEEIIGFFADTMPARAAIDMSGRLEADRGTYTLFTTREDWLAARTETGLDIEFTAPAETRIAQWTSSSQQVSFDYLISGLKASPATGSADIARDGGGPWQVDLEFSASSWEDDTFSLLPGNLSFNGQLDGPRVSGTARIDGGASEIRTNNMRLRNLTGAVAFDVNADLDARSASLVFADGCLRSSAPRAITRNGDFRLRNASFCPLPSGPIVVRARQSEDGDFLLDADGVLAADSLAATIGETTIAGVPPMATLRANIRNRTLSARTDISGGNLRLNERIRFASAATSGDISYEDGALGFDGEIRRLTVSDLREPVAFSPVRFSGMFSVQNADADFSGALAIPDGAQFAILSGDYDLKARAGEAVVDFGPLVLLEDSFQLTDVLPPLKGFVENASGGIGGEVRFDFSAGGLQTAAMLNVEALTFNGPTRAITQTVGLTLSGEFDQLAPLRSVGDQTATMDLVDLDALKLEDGTLTYNAPGDGTLRIPQAVWPWFGGYLRIEDSTIPLDGRQVSVPLVVDDIDIAKLLEFLDFDGLTGSGRMSGELPLIVEDGEAFIRGGNLRATTRGTLNYDSIALENAADAAGDAGQLALDALSAFEFNYLQIDINGSLAGDMKVDLTMRGNSDEVVADAGINYNIAIDLPLSGLIRQFSASGQQKRQIVDELSRDLGVELDFGDIERAEAPEPAE